MKRKFDRTVRGSRQEELCGARGRERSMPRGTSCLGDRREIQPAELHKRLSNRLPVTSIVNWNFLFGAIELEIMVVSVLRNLRSRHYQLTRTWTSAVSLQTSNEPRPIRSDQALSTSYLSTPIQYPSPTLTTMFKR